MCSIIHTRAATCRPPARRLLQRAAGSCSAPLSAQEGMRPKILACGSDVSRSALWKCERLNSDYSKPFFLFNGHVETIWASWFRVFLDLDLDRELVETPDGGVFALDSMKTDSPLPSDAPVVILLPGLAGGSRCAYVQYAVHSAHEAGMRAVVFNARGMASSPVLTPQFYSASYTEDLRVAVLWIQKKFPKAQVCAVGWSLGANILVNYLGEEGDACSLLAAVSLCNPFDLARCDANFRQGFCRVYDWHLAASMKAQFQKHLHLFQGYDVGKVMTANTVRGVDDLITRATFGWESVDAYYRGSSSADRISRVGIPLLCIQAANDPICPAYCIPTESIQANQNCTLVVTPHGGHLGWLTTEDGIFGPPWSDKACLEWLQVILQQTSLKRSKLQATLQR